MTTPDPTATEAPLDDGPRYGPEPWRVVAGVEFCHWDRWLLRLAIAEPAGLDGVANEFRRRAAHARNDQAEAMLAQIVDLQARLAGIGEPAPTVLDPQERTSEWLFQKAWKRVWHSGPNRRTRAMQETPRVRLERRALRGHWPSFPVSPERFESNLLRVVDVTGLVDHRMTRVLAGFLELEVDRLLVLEATSDADRLAIHRAALTVVIGLMEHVDDSMTDMAEVFAGSERAYLGLLPGFLQADCLLHDLLELAVWEGYGLLRGVAAFLGALPEHDADRSVRHLSPVISELKREGLTHQVEAARVLRSALLTAFAARDNGPR